MYFNRTPRRKPPHVIHAESYGDSVFGRNNSSPGRVFPNRPRINAANLSEKMNNDGWGRPPSRFRTTAYTGFGSSWIGDASSKYFSRAGRNFGLAIGGSYQANSWASARDMPRARSPKTGRFYSGPMRKSVYSVGTYNRQISGQNRARLAGAGLSNVGKGLRRLPVKTKIAAPLAIGGAYFWMKRNKKDQFYTHYFDY